MTEDMHHITATKSMIYKWKKLIKVWHVYSLNESFVHQWPKYIQKSAKSSRSPRAESQPGVVEIQDISPLGSQVVENIILHNPLHPLRQCIGVEVVSHPVW